MSVPLYWTPTDCLWAAIRCVACGEGTRLKLAYELEDSRPWAGAVPGFCGIVACTRFEVLWSLQEMSGSCGRAVCMPGSRNEKSGLCRSAASRTDR